ncbi:hypothetical protein BpHYR1_023564 [Brachionus plicatilis]|uniref:Uncharacterized protein n=1 Tax=Brachionus plicatilis TaxID=10195 RepID=A0A3M7PYD2_BRAPC|nr:hypothetical protein BpHYR1_023564 [Brachionus plicatilis]
MSDLTNSLQLDKSTLRLPASPCIPRPISICESKTGFFSPGSAAFPHKLTPIIFAALLKHQLFCESRQFHIGPVYPPSCLADFLLQLTLCRHLQVPSPHLCLLVALVLQQDRNLVGLQCNFLQSSKLRPCLYDRQVLWQQEWLMLKAMQTSHRKLLLLTFHDQQIPNELVRDHFRHPISMLHGCLTRLELKNLFSQSHSDILQELSGFRYSCTKSL